MKPINFKQSLGRIFFTIPVLVSAIGVDAKEVQIPPGELVEAIQELSKQYGAEIIYEAKKLDGIKTQGVNGDIDVEQAIQKLLDGTGLEVYKDSSGAMLITTSRASRSELQAIPIKAAPLAGVAESSFQRISEVVVTARKRPESLQDVPVVITAIGQEQLEKTQVHDLFTLANQVPGFIVGEQNGVLGPGVTLRGVGTTAFNPSIDQSVSLNIDGLQLNQGFAYQTGMFDVGQVEVMRGPQALFFGKNSPAGVISLRSADPGEEVEVIFRTGYESVAEEKFGEVILSGAVSPGLKLRLATHFSDNKGYFSNVDKAPEGFGVRTPTTEEFASKENTIIRGTALFEPSDGYDARLKVNYTESRQNYSGGDTQVATCPGGLTSWTGLPLFDQNEDCTLNEDIYISWPDPEFFPLVRNNGVPFIDARTTFGTLEQNFYFNDLTFTSLTGFYDYKQEQLGNGSGASGAITIVSDNDFSNTQLTQEFRVASDFDTPLNFMAGVFYQDATLKNEPRIYGNTALGLPVSLRHVTHEIDIESLSAFGQLSWDISEQLELSAGVRWTGEERDHEQFNVASAGIPTGPVIGNDSELDSDNLSPEVALTYWLNEEIMLFGAYKTGFKSGSFDSTSYISPSTPLSFEDEEVEGFEVGMKARLFDRSLALNVAFYDYRYTNLQVGAMEVVDGLNKLRTLNAASADVQGVDMDFTWRPLALDGLSLRGSISYNDATYGSFKNATCGNNQTIAQGCDQLFNEADGTFNAQDLSGVPLARAPEWVGYAGVDYEATVADGLLLGVGAGLNYSSEFDTSIIHLPDFVQDSYVKSNAYISLKDAEGAWELSLIGNNLGDEITSAFCANANLNGGLIFGGQVNGASQGGPAGDDYAACSPERGREFWLRLTLRPLLLMNL